MNPQGQRCIRATWHIWLSVFFSVRATLASSVISERPLHTSALALVASISWHRSFAYTTLGLVQAPYITKYIERLPTYYITTKSRLEYRMTRHGLLLTTTNIVPT